MVDMTTQLKSPDPPSGGSHSHRWALISEIASWPSETNYSKFNKITNISTLNEIRNAQRLLDQWGFGGWKPAVKGGGKWDYTTSFSNNNGSNNFLSEIGKKFSVIIQILELSNRSDNFSEICKECIRTIRKIRCIIYQQRCINHGKDFLAGNTINFVTKYHESAVKLDLFRLLCFDGIVRHGSLNTDEIFILWSIFDDLDSHSINDLSSFRTEFDNIINQYKARKVSPLYNSNNVLKMSYHFKEFEAYSETFNIQIFDSLAGSIKEGYVYLGGGEFSQQIQKTLEMIK